MLLHACTDRKIPPRCRRYNGTQEGHVMTKCRAPVRSATWPYLAESVALTFTRRRHCDCVSSTFEAVQARARLLRARYLEIGSVIPYTEAARKRPSNTRIKRRNEIEKNDRTTSGAHWADCYRNWLSFNFDASPRGNPLNIRRSCHTRRTSRNYRITIFIRGKRSARFEKSFVSR